MGRRSASGPPTAATRASTSAGRRSSSSSSSERSTGSRRCSRPRPLPRLGQRCGHRRAGRGLGRPAPHGRTTSRDPLSLVRAELGALSFYWRFLAGICVARLDRPLPSLAACPCRLSSSAQRRRLCTPSAAGVAPASTTRGRRWREASFYAGVLALLVALEPPFDRLADESFAIHMAQHVVLLTVVPPLVVLGRPWPRMWMPFPTRIRRAVVRELALGAWSAPLRAAARVLTRPPVALAVMSASIGAWHVPALYDAAVRSNDVHFAEHACYPRARRCSSGRRCSRRRRCAPGSTISAAPPCSQRRCRAGLDPRARAHVRPLAALRRVRGARSTVRAGSARWPTSSSPPA